MASAAAAQSYFYEFHTFVQGPRFHRAGHPLVWQAFVYVGILVTSQYGGSTAISTPSMVVTHSSWRVCTPRRLPQAPLHSPHSPDFHLENMYRISLVFRINESSSEVLVLHYIPETRRWPNVWLMFGQRRRRCTWPNINPSCGNLKVIYHPLYSMNKFVRNKSKLPQDGAQVFPYMEWLAIMWPSERVT